MIRPQMFSTGGLTPGQQAWTTAGTFSFVVPDYCYEISAVAIGSGASGATGSSSDSFTSGAGGGGALTYLNGIPVTPGETLTGVIGAPGAAVTFSNTNGNNGAAVQLLRGATVLLNANGGTRGLNDGTGGNGGEASAPPGGVSWAGGKGDSGVSTTYAAGGSSGRYTSAGSFGSQSTSTAPSDSADLFGNNTGTTLGHGGAGVKGAPSGAGLVGGLRVIWGAGRSFPSNAADV